MNRGYIYLLFSLLTVIVSFLTPIYIQVFLIWISLSSLYYAIAYLSDYGEMLFKGKDGRLNIFVKIGMFPVLLGATAFNLIYRSKDKVPPLQEIRDGLWLSRRLVFLDLEELKKSPINAVLDVTAEFDAIETHFLGKEVAYLNIPVMDHHSPRKNQLEMAVRWIDQQRKAGKEVLIHCALGQGRSVTVLLAYLKYIEPEKTYMELIDEVRKTRPNVKPNSLQYRSLEDFSKTILKKQDELQIIYNPKSGNITEEKIEKIKELLESFFRIVFHETSENRSASDIAKELVANGKKFLVAAGGDGTVTQVAQAIVNTDALLGIIPLGTANALAASLYGKNARLTPIETACVAITSGETKKIDVAKINDSYMLLLAGVGIERSMTEEAEGDLKEEWGAIGYIISGLRQIENAELFKATLTVDGETHTFETASVTIANAAPKSSIFAQGGEEPKADDGCLTVTVIVNVKNQLEAAETLIQLLKQKETTSSEYLQHFKAHKVSLTTVPEQKVVIDGEIMGKTPIDIELLPKSLQVCGLPKDEKKES